MSHEISLRLLPETFTISKLPQFAELPTILARGDNCFICRSEDELSILCPDFMAPTNVQQDTGWRGFRVESKSALASIGTVAVVSAPLSLAGIPLLVVTMHSSIYFFVKDEMLIEATQAMQHSGLHFVHNE